MNKLVNLLLITFKSNKVMEFLPNTCIECYNTNHVGPYIFNSNTIETTELAKFIEDCIGDDCWAVISDGVILYNLYATREIPEADTQQLDVDDILKTSYETIRIFMFGDKSWEIRINVELECSIYYVISYHKTEESDWDFLTTLESSESSEEF